MSMADRATFDAGRAVLEAVAKRLEGDVRLRRAGVTLTVARGAAGTHVERITLRSANGTFELLAKDDGVYLGSLKEWPLHNGDEQYPEKAADYLASLMYAEAAGTTFHRVSVRRFAG